jgi:hypothetical protein
LNWRNKEPNRLTAEVRQLSGLFCLIVGFGVLIITRTRSSLKVSGDANSNLTEEGNYEEN